MTDKRRLKTGTEALLTWKILTGSLQKPQMEETMRRLSVECLQQMPGSNICSQMVIDTIVVARSCLLRCIGPCVLYILIAIHKRQRLFMKFSRLCSRRCENSTDFPVNYYRFISSTTNILKLHRYRAIAKKKHL